MSKHTAYALNFFQKKAKCGNDYIVNHMEPVSNRKIASPKAKNAHAADGLTGNETQACSLFIIRNVSNIFRNFYCHTLNQRKRINPKRTAS